MDILSLILTLLVWALIFYVVNWGIERIAPPEPWAKIIQVIFVVAVVYVLVGILTGSVPMVHLGDSRVVVN